MQWFRMYAEAVDDEKLRLLAFEDRWHFVALLCLKSQGTLESEDHLERRIAVKLGLRVSELDEVKRRLIDVGLIDDQFQPVAWNRRQFSSDSAEYKAEKQRNYRIRKAEQQALRNGDVTVTTALPGRTDTDTEQIQNRTEKPIAPTREKISRSEPNLVRFVNGSECPAGKFEVAKEIRMQWVAAYPGVQIGTELEKAAAWAASNPTKRKKDWRRFLNNWMSRAQERVR